MKVIGVIHDSSDPNFAAVLRYLKRINWKGKNVAIESPESVQEILESNPTDTEREFFKNVITHIQSHGGSVTAVESRKHYNQAEKLDKSWNIWHSPHPNKYFTDEYKQVERDFPLIETLEQKRKLIAFKRTIRMVHQAANSDFLITGGEHAYHIKKMLGKKSNVRFLYPKYGFRTDYRTSIFIKKINAKRKGLKRQWKDLFWPALRKPGEPKMKRPRLREKMRVRRKK